MPWRDWRRARGELDASQAGYFLDGELMKTAVSTDTATGDCRRVDNGRERALLTWEQDDSLWGLLSAVRLLYAPGGMVSFASPRSGLLPHVMLWRD